MPTRRTGARWLADAEKKVPDPPRTLSALPNGVSTESRATEPTQRMGTGYGMRDAGCGIRDCAVRSAGALHAVGRGDAEERQAGAQHDLRGAGEGQAGARDRLGLTEYVGLVVPQVDAAGEVVQVGHHAVRL